MDEELKRLLDLLKSDPEKAISEIRTTTKTTGDIEKFIKEFKEQDRTQRNSQVDNIQKDKVLTGNKVVRMVKIHINHAQNIVGTLAAFVIGRPVTLIPSEDNSLSDLVKHIWRVNRMDSKLLQATIIKMSETQVVINFFINEIAPTSILNKILIKLGLQSQAKEIKVKVLNNSSGVMTPYFNASGDMLLFMWEFQTVKGSKNINNVQIWDDKTQYNFNDESGKMILIDSPPHGFDRIPMVYDDQLEPQWYAVNSPIDRHEVAISKLGDANDYSGHPILVTEGEVKNMPGKEDSGKHFNIPITFDKEGNEVKGKVSFLEAETAPESNKLEIDKLEDLIAYGSSVPNLTLDKLKALGNVAEKTVKLMFIAPELKAQIIRSDTKIFIERCLNVLISGITNTTNTALATEGALLFYEIHFNSILPADISERVKNITKAVEAGLMSKQTGIALLDLTDDVDDELDLIHAEAVLAASLIVDPKIDPEEGE